MLAYVFLYGARPPAVPPPLRLRDRSCRRPPAGDAVIVSVSRDFVFHWLRCPIVHSLVLVLLVTSPSSSLTSALHVVFRRHLSSICHG
jgi:hypothetical protein